MDDGKSAMMTLWRGDQPGCMSMNPCSAGVAGIFVCSSVFIWCVFEQHRIRAGSRGFRPPFSERLPVVRGLSRIWYQHRPSRASKGPKPILEFRADSTCQGEFP